MLTDTEVKGRGKNKKKNKKELTNNERKCKRIPIFQKGVEKKSSDIA